MKKYLKVEFDKQLGVYEKTKDPSALSRIIPMIDTKSDFQAILRCMRYSGYTEEHKKLLYEQFQRYTKYIPLWFNYVPYKSMRNCFTFEEMINLFRMEFNDKTVNDFEKERSFRKLWPYLNEEQVEILKKTIHNAEDFYLDFQLICFKSTKPNRRDLDFFLIRLKHIPVNRVSANYCTTIYQEYYKDLTREEKDLLFKHILTEPDFCWKLVYQWGKMETSDKERLESAITIAILAGITIRA